MEVAVIWIIWTIQFKCKYSPYSLDMRDPDGDSLCWYIYTNNVAVIWRLSQEDG